jgi:hypothetical protein
MRYQNIDGISEMGIGFLWMIAVLLEKSLSGAPRNTLWHWRGTFVLSIALLGFVVLGGMRALKKRITYPRTGSVKYRGLAGKPWITGLIAGVIAIPTAIFLGYLRHHFKFSVPVALTSAGWGLLYAFMTRMDGPWRWVLLAAMVVGPVVISTLPLDRASVQGLPMAFIGLTYFVSGVIALCLYLRRTRPPEQEAE